MGIGIHWGWFGDALCIEGALSIEVSPSLKHPQSMGYSNVSHKSIIVINSLMSNLQICLPICSFANCFMPRFELFDVDEVEKENLIWCQSKVDYSFSTTLKSQATVVGGRIVLAWLPKE